MVSFKYICLVCNRNDNDTKLLICTGCDECFHTYCLMPPILDNRRKLQSNWKCQQCRLEETNKLKSAMYDFGFDDSEREYTLKEFGEMADSFKTEYFNKPINKIPLRNIEQEFWNIIDNFDKNVTVEYGADINVTAFPSSSTSSSPENVTLLTSNVDDEYKNSNWNLNNLPVLKDSIFHYIDDKLPGVKTPWMYVGMCFSAFCWHTEDHWSYSINYLHWGESKTWYGIPSAAAESFENVMKDNAPEIFESQPGLLFHMVTIINPNKLMLANVPVYRINQYAGEFVVTFPRAYHAGFNNGFNLAEAVNFATADWIPYGRFAIEYYSSLHRICVFSHDEIICRMILSAEKLNLEIAAACYTDLIEMITMEKRLRYALLELRVSNAKRHLFELIDDDNRKCNFCQTTCFLSAIVCSSCNGSQKSTMVCLKHYSELCNCSVDKHVLLYRYTLPEFQDMMVKLKYIVEPYQLWKLKVSQIFDIYDKHISKQNITFYELRQLKEQAVTHSYPDTLLLNQLNELFMKANKCSCIVKELNNLNMKTLQKSRRTTQANVFNALTMDELNQFLLEIKFICCKIGGIENVYQLQCKGQEFLNATKTILMENNLKNHNENFINNIIENGHNLCIDFDKELIQLKYLYEQVNWYQSYKIKLKSIEKPTIKELNELYESGLQITPHKIIEKRLVKLKTIITVSEQLQIQAKLLLFPEVLGNKSKLSDAKELLKNANKIHCKFPLYQQLNNEIKLADKLLEVIASIQTRKYVPYLSALQNYLKQGNSLAFYVEELEFIKIGLASCKSWISKLNPLFLQSPQLHTSLIDLLLPKCRNSKENYLKLFVNKINPMELQCSLKQMQEREVNEMTIIREINKKKFYSSYVGNITEQFCNCNQNLFGIMLFCQLCYNWYHSKCVQLHKLHEYKNVAKYLCGRCMQTKRPHLDRIEKCTSELQEITIRMPEHELMQNLIDRALMWSNRVKEFLQQHSSSLLLTKTDRNKNVNTLKRKLTIDDDSQLQCNKYKTLSTQKLTIDDDNGQLQSNKSKTIFTLENLIFEGDLMELKLDEMQLLWNLYLTMKPIDTKKTFQKNYNVKIKTTITENVNNELCAARPCKIPPNTYIDWIQCDGKCKKWYHFYCISLQKCDLKEEDLYLCKYCGDISKAIIDS